MFNTNKSLRNPISTPKILSSDSCSAGGETPAEKKLGHRVASWARWRFLREMLLPGAEDLSRTARLGTPAATTLQNVVRWNTKKSTVDSVHSENPGCFNKKVVLSKDPSK